jgi:hypothetical protein
MRVFLIATALAYIFLNLFSPPDLFGASPAIRFQEDVFTFKPILEGESVDINFEFSNVGGGTLVIHDAVTSCGCTTADYPSHSIKPGGKGTIKTTFHSKGHGGDNDISLLVKSNDPVEPIKTLRIRGKVIRQWQVKPGRFILTNLKPNRRYSRRLQIINFMDESLQIRELVAGNPHLHFLSKPKEVARKGDEVIDFEVSVKDLNANGIAQSSIRIEVANAEMQSVEIPVLMKLK